MCQEPGCCGNNSGSIVTPRTGCLWRQPGEPGQSMPHESSRTNSVYEQYINAYHLERKVARPGAARPAAPQRSQGTWAASPATMARQLGRSTLLPRRGRGCATLRPMRPVASWLVSAGPIPHPTCHVGNASRDARLRASLPRSVSVSLPFRIPSVHVAGAGGGAVHRSGGLGLDPPINVDGERLSRRRLTRRRSWLSWPGSRPDRWGRRPPLSRPHSTPRRSLRQSRRRRNMCQARGDNCRCSAPTPADSTLHRPSRCTVRAGTR